MKSYLIAAAILAGVAARAFAGECPALIQKAGDELKAATLDEAAMIKVMDRIALGKTQHDEGKHDESVATLNDALQLLGV
ncbi:MAG: hypothetical protein Q8L53_17345 [Aestuariivirga sp.]|nr:hypothetical protein [Aestuariivirga sp.]